MKRVATGKFEAEAELVEYADGRVRLKKPDGGGVTVKVDQLSKSHRLFLLRLKSSKGE